MKNTERTEYQKLLSRYGRAIVHMRQILARRRLGVALGSGVSQSAGLPSWSALLAGIDEQLTKLGVLSRDIKHEAAPLQAQILFSRFRTYQESASGFASIEPGHREAKILSEWRNLLKGVLYKATPTLEVILDGHPYFSALASLCYSTPIVVTYNFDDLLELALNRSSERPSGTIGYYSAWGPDLVEQEGRPVVYHPNGYLPLHPSSPSSELVVLTEDALADQAIDSARGGYSLLLNYYSNATCLFLGFSLLDPAFRSILRQAARRSPGNVHYYIRYCRGGAPPNSVMAEDSQTNFNLFNMVTLHLNDREIAALLGLVSKVSEDDFQDLCVEISVPTRYFHYVAGPVSVGKTTAISKLLGFSIVDEWLSPRDPDLGKPSTDLSDIQKERVNTYIVEQLRMKNNRFIKAPIGLHIMDRAPLDAFAFTERSDYPNKAAQLYEKACMGKSKRPVQFQAGKLLLLVGDPKELETRQQLRGRGGSATYCQSQQDQLLDVYCSNASDGGAYVIETTGFENDTVAKKISWCIHMEPYVEFDFAARLKFYLE